ncbi:MAG: ATP synthase F1 subunit delta, partial [Planctomycetaceae bacterium]|nr:ATP synthase F1 subunit delta [Planctomycetaceae bacterium]
MSDQRLKTRHDSVLDDPGALAVATLYAKSFLAAAAEHGLADAKEELDSFVSEVLLKQPDFRALLCSDTIGRDDKLTMIERAIAPHASEFFTNFLRVLVRHERCGLIPQIAEVADQMAEEAAGRRRVSVRTARPLADGSRQRICEQLKTKLGFDPILQESVDESLIGGLVIQVGDTVYDSSLRSRLKQLQGRLVEKAFNEIQSGRDRFSHP